MARPAGSPMGPQVKAVLLSVLLCLAVLLTQQDQGSRSEKHIPYLNVRFDPWKMNLSWDCQENVTVVTCQMVHKEKGPVTKKPKGKACYCTFATYDLHRGATFVITVNDTSREPIIETYANPGEEGTAAQNFSCAVRNASFMNCTWAKGPAAPEDVQYFLYIQDAKRSKGTECPQYTERSGTHVGCHLQDLSELDFYSYFLVNGTSQQAGIQFFDTILSLNEIGENETKRKIQPASQHHRALQPVTLPHPVGKAPAPTETPVRRGLPVPAGHPDSGQYATKRKSTGACWFGN